MRYSEIIQTNILKNVREKLKDYDVIWHQTGINSAKLILKDGFKTGKELQKGEATGAIFFVKNYVKNVSYSRGERRAIYIPCIITDLNIVDTKNELLIKATKLNKEYMNMVNKGHWSESHAIENQIKGNAENGIFPKNIDGINFGYEYALTKRAANIGLQKAISVLKGVT